MIFEVPEFTRCCCCIPLRGGLLGWGYIKLVFTLLAIILMACVKGDKEIIPGFYYAVGLVIIDIAFTLIFIVGAHKKNYQLLKGYYYYSIVLIVLDIFSVLSSTGFMIYGIVESFAQHPETVVSIPFIIIGFLLSLLFILIQFYIVLLIRSQIKICRSDITTTYGRFENEA